MLNQFILVIAFFIIIFLVYLIKKILYMQTFKNPTKLVHRVKKGYEELLNLLLFKSDKVELQKVIETIAYNKVDGRYLGGYTKRTMEFDVLSFTLDYFYEIVNYVEDKNETFILSFNNKNRVKELEKKLKFSLEKIGGEYIVFPSKAYPLEYEEFITKEILLDYQKFLKKQNVQMAFIDDNSDGYNIILHSFKKEKEVRKAVELIGLVYYKNLDFIE